jgi:inosine/xanthosine triphosphate pyrophosphatase family protein
MERAMAESLNRRKPAVCCSLAAIITVAAVTILFALGRPLPAESLENQVALNTSSPHKLAEYRDFFGRAGIEVLATTVDLLEIEADKLSVVVHKASSVPERALVEDTSLDIEGADVGINVRWLADRIGEFVGRPAVWTCLLAQRIGDEVWVYEGSVRGVIVPADGRFGFGFDAYFQPIGASCSLAEEKPDQFNARALAVEAFLAGKWAYCAAPISEWNGPWQIHD